MNKLGKGFGAAATLSAGASSLGILTSDDDGAAKTGLKLLWNENALVIIAITLDGIRIGYNMMHDFDEDPRNTMNKVLQVLLCCGIMEFFLP